MNAPLNVEHVLHGNAQRDLAEALNALGRATRAVEFATAALAEPSRKGVANRPVSGLISRAESELHFAIGWMVAARVKLGSS